MNHQQALSRSIEALASPLKQHALTLRGNAALTETELVLDMGRCCLAIKSNSEPLLQKLRDYFILNVADGATADLEVIAIEREPVDAGVAFIDWQREPGKTGRKDSYFDFPGGRLVRKVRTGMVFLQSPTLRLAAGHCLANDNQVINFINSQYMNYLQQRGWTICHSAGLVGNGKTVAIAGFSGGGKSTAMLHALENPKINYMTNDRLFVNKIDGQPTATGIPKLPRINPGTIVYNPRLQPLIPAEQRSQLRALPTEELWNLEQKYDVMIGDFYGPDRLTPEAPLAAFVILNWRRDASRNTALNQVDLAERRDLLGAIMKSPGPFYQDNDGQFQQDQTPLDEQAYLDALADVTIYEVSGRVDFDALSGHYLQQLLESS